MGIWLWQWRSHPKPDPDPELLAIVGPRQIRVSAFKAEMTRRRKAEVGIPGSMTALKAETRGSGDEAGYPDKKALLEELIEREVLIAKAMEAGLDRDPDVVRSYENLLIGRLRALQMDPQIENVKVSAEELQSYYQSHINQFTRNERVRLAMLYLKTDPSAGEARKEEIAARLREAREKTLQNPDVKNFGSVAVDYSEDQATRYQGGEIGWVEAGRAYLWNQAVLAAGFQLAQPGDISDVITAEDGFYLVRLLERRVGEVLPFEQAENLIRPKLLIEKRNNLEQSFKMQARASLTVQSFPSVLDNIQLPTPTPDSQYPQK